MGLAPDLLLYLGAALVALVTCWRLPRALATWANVDFVSGVWTANADDAARGQLYRPLAADGLYGGTRYFPCHILAQAGLIRLGLPPVQAGLLLATSSMAVAVGAVAWWLMLLATPPAAAWSVALLVFATRAGQVALGSIAGHSLGAALSLLGFAATQAVLLDGSPAWSPVAGVCFAASLGTKQTAVYGPVIGFVALVTGGHVLAGLGLGLAAGGVLWALARYVERASDGRARQVLGACTAGGTNPRHALGGPLHLVRELSGECPVSFAVMLAALAAAAGMVPHWNLPVAAFCGAVVMLLAVFATPGAWYPHFAEPFALALVALAALPEQVAAPGARFALLGLAGGCGAALVYVWGVKGEREADRRAELRELADALAARPEPWLCDEPLIPLLAGRRPVVLDSFMFKHIVLADDARRAALAADLAAGRYGAVVSHHDLEDPEGAAKFDQHALGAATREQILAAYRLAQCAGGFYLYVPAG